MNVLARIADIEYGEGAIMLLATLVLGFAAALILCSGFGKTAQTSNHALMQYEKLLEESRRARAVEREREIERERQAAEDRARFTPPPLK